MEEVEAANKREAKVKAVREFRKRRSRYCEWGDENPFTGLEVHDLKESDGRQ